MIELIAQTINFWVFVLTSILSLLILVGVIYGPYRIIRYVLSRIVTMAGRWKKNRLGRRTKEFMINAWAETLINPEAYFSLTKFGRLVDNRFKGVRNQNRAQELQLGAAEQRISQLEEVLAGMIKDGKGKSRKKSRGRK